TEKSILEIAVYSPFTSAETQRVTEGVPKNGGNAHRNETLDHDREHVLAADKPAIKKRKTRSHQHHEASSYQHKAGIASIEIHRLSFLAVQMLYRVATMTSPRFMYQPEIEFSRSKILRYKTEHFAGVRSPIGCGEKSRRVFSG